MCENEAQRHNKERKEKAALLCFTVIPPERRRINRTDERRTTISIGLAIGSSRKKISSNAA